MSWSHYRLQDITCVWNSARIVPHWKAKWIPWHLSKGLWVLLLDIYCVWKITYWHSHPFAISKRFLLVWELIQKTVFVRSLLGPHLASFPMRWEVVWEKMSSQQLLEFTAFWEGGQEKSLKSASKFGLTGTPSMSTAGRALGWEKGYFFDKLKKED